MQRLEVSGAVRPIYGSLGVKRLIINIRFRDPLFFFTRVVSLTTGYCSRRNRKHLILKVFLTYGINLWGKLTGLLNNMNVCYCIHHTPLVAIFN